MQVSTIELFKIDLKSQIKLKVLVISISPQSVKQGIEPIVQSSLLQSPRSQLHFGSILELGCFNDVKDIRVQCLHYSFAR
jgi:hypothetical protein